MSHVHPHSATYTLFSSTRSHADKNKNRTGRSSLYRLHVHTIFMRCSKNMFGVNIYLSFQAAFGFWFHVNVKPNKYVIAIFSLSTHDTRTPTAWQCTRAYDNGCTAPPSTFQFWKSGLSRINTSFSVETIILINRIGVK